MHGISLSQLPLGAKVFCTLFLLGIGGGAVAAVTQAATAVGLSPAQIQASLAPDMPMTHLGHGPPPPRRRSTSARSRAPRRSGSGRRS